MHVLIIPSEGFVPDEDKLAGIFQYHQAVILKEAGYRVGALSVRLSFSVPMIAKGIAFKLIGKKAGNATDEKNIPELMRLGFKKFFSPKEYIKTETLDGIKVYRIDGLYRRKPANNKNHLSWIKAGMHCFENYLEKEGRPDIIHAHDAIYAGMLAERIHAKYGIKYLITEHSSSFALGATDAGILRRVRKAHKSAAGLFAVSEAFAQLLNGMFNFQRFCYLPNVLDQYLERTDYKQAKTSNAKFRFLHIAVFKPVKDQQTLIKAFKLVVKQNEDVELLIGGDGELVDELHSLVQKNSLQNHIRFLGRLNRDEVIEQLKACDAFVLSSKYETFGLVIVEAMLFGKPVIATRCGVSQKIVDDKIGYVVEVGDEEALAEAMLKMMKTTERYDADYIRNFTIEHFGKERFLQNLSKIYKEAV
ncbi:glycosyltransferase [Flavisolibacter ginsenosidimutans]|nr:glycosyltransferase [Flavisolibacter ginsenosidimutans]